MNANAIKATISAPHCPITIDPVLDVDSTMDPPVIVAFGYVDLEPVDPTDMAVTLHIAYSPVYRTVDVWYYLETEERLRGPYPVEPSQEGAAMLMDLIEAKCKVTTGYPCASYMLLKEQGAL